MSNWIGSGLWDSIIFMLFMICFFDICSDFIINFKENCICDYFYKYYYFVNYNKFTEFLPFYLNYFYLDIEISKNEYESGIISTIKYLVS